MKLDIRDIAIIDALPLHNIVDKSILDVGCGKSRVGRELSLNMGYRAYATDCVSDPSWVDTDRMTFHRSDIFDIDSFPIVSCSIVLCCEVLEHLIDYKKAIANLLILTRIRLIITVPFETSFNDLSPSPEGHCNYWSDSSKNNYKDISEFKKLCVPYAVSITKIRTKPRDVQMKQWGYLIVIDKRQKYG